MTALPASRTPGDRPARRPIDRLLATRITMNWELAIYLGIFALAFALRFWDLGARALHHDESIHAQWSWKLPQGDYVHSPIFHGPLYYHVQGLVFLVAGASDYTARVSAAIFGMILVALPLLLRRWLGTAGTIAAMAFIALSPTIVYYSRFFREDIYMAVFTMVMVVAMWRYIASRHDRWLIIFALAYAASHATKEATYITAAIFLVFLSVHTAYGLAEAEENRREGSPDRWRLAGLTMIYSPIAWAIASAWPFLGSIRQRRGWGEALSAQGDVLVILGTLSVPMLTRFLLDVPGLSSAFANNELSWHTVCTFAGNETSSGADGMVVGGLFAVTIAGAALVGLNWRPRTWAIAFGGSALLFLLLYTSFGQNLSGACTGAWGGLDYWLEQQGERRGNQPWYYYGMLMPAYEFLTLGVAIVGAWWAVTRGGVFPRFLLFWMVGMFVALSIAGEKMPWLNMHIALPCALLAAWAINHAWTSWRDRPEDTRQVAYSLLSVAAIAVGALGTAAFLPESIGGWPRALIVLVGVAAIAFAVRSFGRSSTGIVIVTAIVGSLSLFSVYTMINATFVRGDVPKDLLIYTQSGPDVTRIADQIDTVAEATGKGRDLRIAVDTTDSFTWPWAWYLRDYRGLSYYNFNSGVPNGDWDILIVNRGNVDSVTDWLTENQVSTFGAPVDYQHRIWFPESYKTRLPDEPLALGTWEELFDGVVSGDFISAWGDFWLHHDPDRLNTVTRTDVRCGSCGAANGVVFFPAAFDPTTGELAMQRLEPPGPGTDEQGRLRIGGFGTLDGQFVEPIDAAVDAEGNLYVVDRSRAVIQKFDAEGNFLTKVNLRDLAPDPQPWGITVAPDGTVVLADTFAWTVRLFNPNLEPIRTIGEIPDDDIGPFDLFGPRDAVVTSDGQVWVTDTGHGRIQVFTLDGEFVMTVGEPGTGPGQLDEPVGLALAADGTVWVAEMFNARIQGFNAQGESVGTIPVDGWGTQEVDNKPYITALTDGRLAVSLPLAGEVRIYQRDGTLDASIAGDDGAPLNRPYGIAEAPGGSLWIVEAGAQQARLFPIPAN